MIIRRWVLCLLLACVQAAFAAPGNVDVGFDPDANSLIYCTGIQPDGKVLIGGNFTSVGGFARSYFARLNADGTLETGFDPKVNGTVSSAAVQTDGRIVIGGVFNTVGGTNRNRIARLNTDGTIDPDFNPNASGAINSVTLQADGKIIVGGSFANIAGTARNRLARLNTDGTLDLDFNPDASGPVNNTTVQRDGKIIVGGNFSTIGGAARNYLARLNTDGTLDPNFNPNAIGIVFNTALQADGKIVIGGLLTTVSGVARNRIARLNTDGTLDTSFNPNASSSVYSIVVQADGKIIIGGSFTNVGGAARKYIARLNADGTADAGFNPNASTNVYGIMVQPDGKIVIGGSFTNVNGQSRNRLARLANDPATRSLTVPGLDRVEWQRGGTSHETQEATFELSRDSGTNWTSLGTGTRITGGWGLTNLSLPASGQVRARARTIGGYFNSSSGLIEAVAAFSGLNAAPTDISLTSTSVVENLPSGTTVGVFSAADPNGGETHAYTFAEGVGDSGNTAFSINGTNLLTAAMFDYETKNSYSIRVRATDSGGLFFEKQFTIAITDVADTPPSITAQPQGVTNGIGGEAVFTVTASGSPPLAYQWRFGGNALADATNGTLILTNVARTNSGYYAVVVTNGFGSVTSSNALFMVGGVAQRILPLTALGGGRYQISFADFDGGQLFDWDLSSLELQGSTNMSSTNWVTLTNALVISNGVGQVEFVVTNSPPQQFYRIRMR